MPDLSSNSKDSLPENFSSKLFNILLKMPALDKCEDRNFILKGIPEKPVHSLCRSNNKHSDLWEIISHAKKWGRIHSSGKWALVMIAENALELVEGTDLGGEIELLLKSIEKGCSNPASVVNDNLETRAGCPLQCERDAQDPSKSTNQVGLLWWWWIQWIVMTAIGWSLGKVLGEYNHYELHDVIRTVFNLSDTVASYLLCGSVSGVVLGFLQSMLLFRRIHILHVFLWIIATSIGWAVGWAIGGSLPDNGVFHLVAIASFGGAFAGIVQCLLISRHYPSRVAWIAASAFGWFAGAASAFGWFADREISVLSFLLDVVCSAIAGSITGIVLLWLLSRPLQEHEGLSRVKSQVNNL
jgi:hypothetical protein